MMRKQIRLFCAATFLVFASSCYNDDDLNRCDEDDGFSGSQNNLILLDPESSIYNVGDVLRFTFEVDAINSIVLIENFNMLEYTGEAVGEIRLPDYSQLFDGNRVTFTRGTFSGLNTIIVPLDSSTRTYRAVAEIELNKPGSYSFISEGVFLLNGGDCKFVSISTNVLWSTQETVQFEVIP
jgi:hypothetical protein